VLARFINPDNLPKKGDRIEAVNFTYSTVIDDNVTVPPGTQGTVTWSDDLQIGMKWDNGSTIQMVPGDQWKVLTDV
jgi:hypothetical protein